MSFFSGKLQQRLSHCGQREKERERERKREKEREQEMRKGEGQEKRGGGEWVCDTEHDERWMVFL